jgi:hypothetical protein
MSALFVVTGSLVLGVALLAWASMTQRFDPVLATVMAWQVGTLYALGAVWRFHPWGRWTLICTSVAEILLVAMWLVRTRDLAVGAVTLVPASVLVLYGLRSASALVVLNRARTRRFFDPAEPQIA